MSAPSPASPLAAFLHAVAAIRATGAATPETSYYTPIENLLNAVGHGLKPAVRAVSQLADLGAGRPDFGLFSAGLFERTAGAATPERVPNQAPDRGAGEVKSPAESLKPLLAGKQVSKYWARYQQVLVTNLREWVFVAADAAGQPLVLDSFALAASEAEFWALTHHPAAVPEALAAGFGPFLERCLRHAAPLEAPADLAWFLAAFAREARQRLEAADPEHLAPLRGELEGALGVKFTGPKGERFLRATVVQTLFYGVFSAWVLWHRDGRAERPAAFRWRDAPDYLQLPVMQVLFEHVGKTSFLQRVNLRDLLDRTDLVLARVRRERFFAAFAEAEAIQYFYEPFLEAYDPVLRRELGVWYTPPELVRYMVARVDWALRTELNIPDGLADERVVVLDPCCGTGTFLVEVVRFLSAALEARGEGNMRAEALRKAVTTRLFGFELLTAPFVVAHLQLGLALRAADAGLPPHQRAAVYLTNALTGWEPTTAERQLVLDPALREEAERARHVKREERIWVVLGNPPYDGFAGVAVGEERALSDAYRSTTRTAAPQGQGLNELYVRFFRMAERQIAQVSGRGLVCFVSNYSWLDGLSHPGMRERFLTAFDRIWVDNLNGDKYATGKTTPTGAPDPSVFSTPFNREGIQVGAGVVLLARHERDPAAPLPAPDATVQYRDFWGKTKRADLDAIAAEPAGPLGGPAYQTLLPNPALGLPFKPRAVEANYLTWPTLPEVFPVYVPGVQTKRDEFVIDVDADELKKRVGAYFDTAVSDAQMATVSPRAMEVTTAFDPVTTRRTLQKRGLLPKYFLTHLYRPLDVRWLYWEPDTNLLERKSPDHFKHLMPDNVWLVSQQHPRRDWSAPQVASGLVNLDAMDRSASALPLYLTGDLTSNHQRRPNLSRIATDYLATVGADPATLFYHALATLHAPAYREANAGALRQDWPRVPLPTDLAALQASAALGREVAALLDVQQPVPGVTTGALRPEWRALGALTVAADPTRQLDAAAGHFRLTAPWGYPANGTVMPGAGRVSDSLTHPGHLDIWLNDAVVWATVPAAVWRATLGGYPVLKKWLSYRAEAVLGRALHVVEAQEFGRLVRRLAAWQALGPALDAAHARAAAG